MKKEKQKEPFLKMFLDFIATISIIGFFIILILRVWVKEQWVLNVLLTDIVVFIGGLFIYWIEYIPSENKEK